MPAVYELPTAATIPGGNAPNVPALIGDVAAAITSRYETTVATPAALATVTNPFIGMAVWVESIKRPAFLDNSAQWRYDIDNVATIAALADIQNPRTGQEVWVVALSDSAVFVGGEWLYDTGWLNPVSAYTANWATSGSLPVRARIRRGVVAFEGAVATNGAGIPVNTASTVCILAAAFRPPRQKKFPLVAHTANRFGWMVINADGSVQIDNPPTAAGVVLGAGFDHIIYRTT